MRSGYHFVSLSKTSTILPISTHSIHISAFHVKQKHRDFLWLYTITQPHKLSSNRTPNKPSGYIVKVLMLTTWAPRCRGHVFMMLLFLRLSRMLCIIWIEFQPFSNDAVGQYDMEHVFLYLLSQYVARNFVERCAIDGVGKMLRIYHFPLFLIAIFFIH